MAAVKSSVKPCLGQCGFFGAPEHDGFCSKCYSQLNGKPSVAVHATERASKSRALSALTTPPTVATGASVIKAQATKRKHGLDDDDDEEDDDDDEWAEHEPAPIVDDIDQDIAHCLSDDDVDDAGADDGKRAHKTKSAKPVTMRRQSREASMTVDDGDWIDYQRRLNRWQTWLREVYIPPISITSDDEHYTRERRFLARQRSVEYEARDGMRSMR